ncbi:FG-GAP-like repeat-containing protein [Candidatus Binatia bacterium]|nr:FG-GAP-like repeat-containing protein [Candidatus Binatia bacterium]
MRQRFLTLLVSAGLVAAFSSCSRRDTEPRPAATPTAVPAKAPAAAGIPPQHATRVVELFNRGVGLMDRFEPVEAIKAFEEMVGLAPDWTLGRLNYGIALLNGQTDEFYGRAEVELKKVIAVAPDDPYAHYALGMLLRHLTRFEEAKAQFEEVLRIDPEDADAHYQLGILVMDKDPAAARAHLEKTLAKTPHHESACYRLQSLLIKAGEKERAQELMSRFRALKAAKAGAFSGMKYGEMGRYAEVIRAFPGLAAAAEAGAVPAFTDAAESHGLTLAAAGNPGWPGVPLTGGAPAFAPGVAADDIDGDGDVDTYLVAAGPDARGALLRNEGGHFAAVADSGIDGSGAIGAFFGDYDADGDPDLYLTRAGTNRLYRNEGGGRFADVTAATATAGKDVVSAGAAWADADHDGDLDLYVANVASTGAQAPGAPNALFRNNGDGTFVEVAEAAGIDGGDAATVGVLFFDLDDDRDLDLLLLNANKPNRVFLNDRVGQYTDATARFADLSNAGASVGAMAGDVDLNGREDLLILLGAEPPRLFLQVERGRFVEDQTFAAVARGLGGAANAALGDLDLDGDLDLVLFDSGRDGGVRHRILMNSGGGIFAPPAAFGAERAAPAARGAVAADFGADGGLDLLVARAGARPEFWQAPAVPGRHWLQVIPAKAGEGEARWVEPAAVGLQVEVKTGRRLQVGSVKAAGGYLGSTPRQAHFGLGADARADYVRLNWPDAVLQSELEVAADQSWRVPKVLRKPSSCPLLFAWDGKGFAFVTDFLGVGGLGFFIAPGEYAPPDPTEDVRIPPELIRPRDGRYVLRIAEPLEEITYLDEVHLHAYDHPAGWEVYPDERFTGSPPFPTGRPLAAADKIFPQAARTDRGEDVRERILTIDRRYVEPPMDRRFIGYAQDHWIEIDFGDRLRGVAPDARLVLYLYSWVEYTYSHVNYAASQAGLRMQSPRIEVPDGKGGWRVAMAEAGYPGGLPRMMTVDISELPWRSDGRLRIRTNMEVYWDQIFAAVDVSGPELTGQVLRPAVAELRYLGYPREYSPDGANPTLYDYHRVDQGLPFKNLTGNYTRFGDVRPLLEAADDKFAIFGRGEELALEFDAMALPALPDGRARTVVLHADGYCKDMNLYTAFPDTVEPLPYHAMDNYPPSRPGPATPDHERYAAEWNTRRVVGQ